MTQDSNGTSSVGSISRSSTESSSAESVSVERSNQLQTDLSSYFSERYEVARERFRAQAQTQIQTLGGALASYPIGCESPSGEPLTIDFARIGPPLNEGAGKGTREIQRAQRALMISSGVHGVEGFFGSAVQLALLESELMRDLPSDVTLIFIHAVNPYGFAHLRRVNESNVDLNRNALSPDETYEGADPMYLKLDALLNPKTPPKRELFLLRAGAQIARHGMGELKRAIALGQYERPQGLFFGGHAPSRSLEVLREQLPAWVEGARSVVHLDLHTGLGERGGYVIAGDSAMSNEAHASLVETFGARWVAPLDYESGVLYPVRGELMLDCAKRCQSAYPSLRYTPLLAEFGTYPGLTVLRALREEDRATHYCAPDDPRLVRARERLLEIFAPADITWRNLVVRRALGIINRALHYTHQA